MGINSGILQGSILGPLLFNLYINDIDSIDDTVEFIIYADDISLFFTSSTTDDLIPRCNHVLRNLHKWDTFILPSVNSTATKAILFQGKR